MPGNVGIEAEFSNVVSPGRIWDDHYDLLSERNWCYRKRLDKYGVIRQTLLNMSLVNQTEARDCGKPWSDDWRCDFVTSTHFCTFQVGPKF